MPRPRGIGMPKPKKKKVDVDARISKKKEVVQTKVKKARQAWAPSVWDPAAHLWKLRRYEALECVDFATRQLNTIKRKLGLQEKLLDALMTKMERAEGRGKRPNPYKQLKKLTDQEMKVKDMQHELLMQKLLIAELNYDWACMGLCEKDAGAGDNAYKQKGKKSEESLHSHGAAGPSQPL